MLTCPRCDRPLYPRAARRTDDGWVCADTRACNFTRAKSERLRRQAADNAARYEDLTWMAATGESAEGAAARLGLSVEALERWCHRHAPELWGRLGRWAA